MKKGLFRRHKPIFSRTQRIAARRIALSLIAISILVGITHFITQRDYSTYADATNQTPQRLVNLNEITTAPEINNYTPSDDIEDNGADLLSILKDRDFDISIYNGTKDKVLTASTNPDNYIEYTGFIDRDDQLLAEIKNLNIDEKKVEDHKVYSFEIPTYFDTTKDAAAGDWKLLDTRSIINGWGRIVKKDDRYILQFVFDNTAKAIHISANYQFSTHMRNLPAEGGEVNFCFGGGKCLPLKIKEEGPVDDIKLEESCNWDDSYDARSGGLSGKVKCDVTITNPTASTFTGNINLNSGEDAFFVFYGGWKSLQNDSEFRKYTLNIEKKAESSSSYNTQHWSRYGMPNTSASMYSGDWRANSSTFEYTYRITEDGEFQDRTSYQYSNGDTRYNTGTGCYISRNIDIAITESKFYQLHITYWMEPEETTTFFNITASMSYSTSNGLSGTKTKSAGTGRHTSPYFGSIQQQSLGTAATSDLCHPFITGDCIDRTYNNSNIIGYKTEIDTGGSRILTTQIEPTSVNGIDNIYYFYNMFKSSSYSSTYLSYYLKDALRIRMTDKTTSSSFDFNSYSSCQKDFSYLKYKDPVLYKSFVKTYERERKTSGAYPLVCYTTAPSSYYYADGQFNNFNSGIYLVIWQDTIAEALEVGSRMGHGYSSNYDSDMFESYDRKPLGIKFSLLGVANQRIDLQWFTYQRQLSRHVSLPAPPYANQYVGMTMASTTPLIGGATAIRDATMKEPATKAKMLETKATRLEDGAIMWENWLDITDLTYEWRASGSQFTNSNPYGNKHIQFAVKLDDDQTLTDTSKYYSWNGTQLYPLGGKTNDLMGIQQRNKTTVRSGTLYYGRSNDDPSTNNFTYYNECDAFSTRNNVSDIFSPNLLSSSGYNIYYTGGNCGKYFGNESELSLNGKKYLYYMYISEPTRYIDSNEVMSEVELMLNVGGTRRPLIDALSQAGATAISPSSSFSQQLDSSSQKVYTGKMTTQLSSTTSIDNKITQGTYGNTWYHNGQTTYKVAFDGTMKVAEPWTGKTKDVNPAKYFKLRDIRYSLSNLNSNTSPERIAVLPGMTGAYSRYPLSLQTDCNIQEGKRYSYTDYQTLGAQNIFYRASNSLEVYIDYGQSGQSPENTNMSNGANVTFANLQGVTDLSLYSDFEFDQESFRNNYPGYAYIDLTNTKVCTTPSYSNSNYTCEKFDKSSVSSDFAHIVIGPHIEAKTDDYPKTPYTHKYSGTALVGPQASDYVYITNQIVEVGDSIGYRYGLKDKDNDSSNTTSSIIKEGENIALRKSSLYTIPVTKSAMPPDSNDTPALTISPEAIREYASHMSYTNLNIYAKNTEDSSQPAIAIVKNGEVQPGWTVREATDSEIRGIAIPEDEVPLGSGGKTFNFHITKNDGQIPANTQFDITYDYTLDEDFRDSEYYHGGRLTITNQLAIATANGDFKPSSGTCISVLYLDRGEASKTGNLMHQTDEDEKEKLKGKQSFFYSLMRRQGTAGKENQLDSHWHDTLFITANLDEEQAEAENKQYGDDKLNQSWINLWYKHAVIKNWSLKYEDAPGSTTPILNFNKTIDSDGNVTFTGANGVVVKVNTSNLQHNANDNTWSFDKVNSDTNEWNIENYCHYNEKTSIAELVRNNILPHDTANYGYCSGDLFEVDINRQEWQTRITVDYELEIDWSALFKEADEKGLPDLPRYAIINSAKMDSNQLWKNTGGWNYMDSFNGRLTKDSKVNGSSVDYNILLEVGPNGYSDLLLSDELTSKDGLAADVENNTQIAIRHQQIKNFRLEDGDGRLLYKHDGVISDTINIGNYNGFYKNAKLTLNGTLFDLSFEKVNADTELRIKYTADLTLGDFVSDGGYLDKDISYSNKASAKSGRYTLDARSDAKIPANLEPKITKTVANGETARESKYNIKVDIGTYPSENIVITDRLTYANMQIPESIKDYLSITSLRIYSSNKDSEEKYLVFDSDKDNLTHLAELGWTFNTEFDIKKAGAYDFTLTYDNINKPLAANTIYDIEYVMSFDADKYNSDNNPNNSFSWNLSNNATLTRDGVSKAINKSAANRSISTERSIEKTGRTYDITSGTQAGTKYTGWSVNVNLDTFLTYEELRQAQEDAQKEDVSDDEYIHIVDNFPVGTSSREGYSTFIRSINPYKTLTEGVDYKIVEDSKHIDIILLKPHDYPRMAMSFSTIFNTNSDGIENSINVTYKKAQKESGTTSKKTPAARAIRRSGILRAYPKPAYKIELTKKLDGVLSKVPFKFEVREIDRSGREISSGFNNIITNDESGIARTDPIENDLGTYYYKIREINTGATDYRFDKSEYIAIVTANADEDDVTPTIDMRIINPDGTAVDKLEFNNISAKKQTTTDNPKPVNGDKNPFTVDHACYAFMVFGLMSSLGLALWLHEIKRRR